MGDVEAHLGHDPASMNPEELTLDVPGLRLSALAWGPPDGRRVLALHGWLDNAASFEGIGPALAAGGARVVALDLPGHGRSDHRAPGESYDFLDWTVDVAAALDALGWDRAALLGHSMGAAACAMTAGTLPERVERLALLEGLAPNTVPAAEAPDRLARSIAQRGRREARVGRSERRAFPDLEAAAARLREAVDGLGRAAALRLVARGTKPVEGGLAWSADARLRGTSPFRITEEHVRVFLARIACPTLVVRAERGWDIDPRLLAARAACIPDLRVAVVPGAHHVHLDDPVVVLAHLAPFLEGRPGPAAMGARELEAVGLRLPGALGDALRKVKLVVLDVDGVLTDGGLAYGPDGDHGKLFNVRDGLGIKALQRAGLEVAIVTGRLSKAVEVRAKDLGVARLFTGVQDKGLALDQLLADTGLAADAVCAIGDDLVDLPLLVRVGVPAAPGDAADEAKAAAKVVTRSHGGRGAVRELAELILRAQGRWEAEVAHHRRGR